MLQLLSEEQRNWKKSQYAIARIFHIWEQDLDFRLNNVLPDLQNTGYLLWIVNSQVTTWVRRRWSQGYVCDHSMDRDVEQRGSTAWVQQRGSDVNNDKRVNEINILIHLLYYHPFQIHRDTIFIINLQETNLWFLLRVLIHQSLQERAKQFFFAQVSIFNSQGGAFFSKRKISPKDPLASHTKPYFLVLPLPSNI